MSEHESACARVAARFRQRWLRGYVGSKLRRDPVFEAAYDLFKESDKPILDLGCGVGLLAFYLRERGCRQSILGLDIDRGKIERGREIATRQYGGIELRYDDVRTGIPEFDGDVVLFDLLHYLPPAQQMPLLSGLKERVGCHGVLILRDGVRDGGARFWMTWGAEKFAQFISWNLKTSLHFPSREEIDEVFAEAEFERECRPMWGGSPFNNYLFVFRKK